ncbi:hypothetical protein AAZX31_01G101100 [Glycine max]
MMLSFLSLRNIVKYRRPPIDTGKGKLNLKLQKQHNCIPDEHYVQTLRHLFHHHYLC